MQPGEPETEPFTLPEGITPAPRNPLFRHPSLEIAKPMPVTLIGFAAGWVAVAALIAALYWIMMP